MANADSITGLLQKIRTTNWKFDFDILILQVKNGPHIFITVTGEYKPSCFGLSMETLCRTNRPLCEYDQQQIKELVSLYFCCLCMCIGLNFTISVFLSPLLTDE